MVLRGMTERIKVRNLDYAEGWFDLADTGMVYFVAI